MHLVNGQPTSTRYVDYNLDMAGNRTGTAGVTADGTPFSYTPNALNHYENANGGPVGNGLNHEITSYDGKNYTYLNDTHLAQVSFTDVSGVHLYSLGYDALGRCVKRTTGISSSSYYIYDGDKPIYEFDSAGGTPSINVYGRGIDEILYRSNHGSGQYFEQDHEGSVIAVTGGDGTLLEWYRYDAFGSPTMYKPDGSVNTTGASLINNRFLFTGREYAPQYGFYEYRARAYHPGIGRFMSEDPGLFVRGMTMGKVPSDWSFEKHPNEAELNLFRYCNNDPWDLVDPMGLDAESNGDGTYHYVVRSVISNLTPLVGGFVNNSQWKPLQCAGAAQHLAGTQTKDSKIHDVPLARNGGWHQGAPLTKDTPNGTLVAAGWEHGVYPNKNVSEYNKQQLDAGAVINHTGIKVGWDEKSNSAWILSQNGGGNGSLQVAKYDPNRGNWSVVNASAPYQTEASSSKIVAPAQTISQ